MRARDLALGAAAAVGVRSGLRQVLLLRFRRDVRRLNQGDFSSLLTAYGDDFVLHFHRGEHRWSGDWHGKQGMERFLATFVASRIQGELGEIAMSGPPWAMTLWARFDDHADGPDGTRLYENRTVLVLRTRWGKVVEQDDFFADTAAIVAFDRSLAQLDADVDTSR